MGWTKAQLIDEAFSELTLQGYEFDITAEEMGTARRRLDTMMAMWAAKGINLGYKIPSSPDDDSVNDLAGIPDSACEPVFLNLALRLCAGFGKQPPATTIKTAREGYDTLLIAVAYPQQQQNPATMPYGAGNRYWRQDRPFFPRPDRNPLAVGPGGDLDFLE